VFVYQFNGGINRIPLGDILYFESKLRKIEIVTRTETTEPSVHSFYGKLDEVEAQLQHPGFVRIHHSMLVNLDNVDRFEQGALFLGSRRLPLAHSKQKEVRQKARAYFRRTCSDSITAPPPPPPGGRAELSQGLFPQYTARNTAGAVNHRRMVCAVLPAQPASRNTTARSITVKFPRRVSIMAADPLKHHKYSQ
jgi:hypothetical protein